MQNKSFLTPVLLFLCLIVLTVIGLGVVTAIDRQRFQTEALTKAVSELSDRIDLLQSRGVAVAAGGGVVAVERAGNAEFFDPNADQGGRFILANTSDTGNMNGGRRASFRPGRRSGNRCPRTNPPRRKRPGIRPRRRRLSPRGIRP